MSKVDEIEKYALCDMAGLAQISYVNRVCFDVDAPDR